MLAVVETYVPHTGSFLSSPPERTSGGRLGAFCGATAERKPSMMLLKIALTSHKNKRGSTMSRRKRRIMESGRDAVLPPRTLADCYYFFFLGASLALGFL